MHIIHTPVLLQECLFWLSPKRLEYGGEYIMIDSTLGEGGHSEAFLKTYDTIRAVGVDADPVIQERAKERLASFGARMSFYSGWFNDFYANYPAGLSAPDILLFDLGISLFHYAESGRGFSFRSDEPLDMRLDVSSGMPAEDMINTMPQDELASLFFNYGEERYSRRIARAVVERRSASRIVSTKELADIVSECVPAAYRHGRIHPATKVFQALRIAVNGELQRLTDALPAAFSVLKVGGLMGVITFHSLEDRLVKLFFRAMARACTCPAEQPVCICGGVPCAEILTKKPVAPAETEIANNGPSRSAKLRVVRKLGDVPAVRTEKRCWMGSGR